MSLLTPNLALWIGFAALTGAAVWALLAPMRRLKASASGDASPDVALYRDQLAEVERDRERGILGEAEAESARIEVSRRLLAAVEAAEAAGTARALPPPRRTAFAMMLVVPLLSLGIYLALGSPDMPDAPFAPRVAGPADQLPLDALVIKVEQHLKEQPEDVRGWEVIAPAYMRQQKYNAAAAAWSRAMALDGETAGRLAARGEALVFAAQGALTPDARQDFAAAVALDAGEPRAQYYLGLADIQDGNKDKAVTRWQSLLQGASPDAPWRASIEAELAALTAPASPAPDAAQIEAAGQMSAKERQQMIEGMVAGLAARLDDAPDDLAGWQRLIRAYQVLGRKADADAALVRARAQFAGNHAALAGLDAAAKALPPQ